MIAEIIPGAYDSKGKKISKPTGKRIRTFHPTFPMGRYLSQPLSNRFDTIEALRRFLLTCKYVSDEEQFDKSEYWVPPEEFEKRKKGDCEDFALYAWRQLIEMGIPSRFVAGESGRYGTGHAWVTMELKGRYFIVEPLACAYKKLPRLSMIRYMPEISVAFHVGKISYYAHKKIDYNPSLPKAFGLCFEWILFWVEKMLLFGFTLIVFPINLVRKKVFKNTRSRGAADSHRPGP